MEISPQARDTGQSLEFVDGEALYWLTVEACTNPLCTCDRAELTVEGDEVDGSMRFALTVSTREARPLDSDPEAAATPAQATWLTELLRGALGDRVTGRVARTRAQADRRSWQRLDAAVLDDDELVPSDVLFPHDWTLAMLIDDRWVRDRYCTRVGCDCNDVRLEIHDEHGRRGVATVQVAGSRLRIAACDAEIADEIASLCRDPRVRDAVEDRYSEARGVARARATWAADCAEPERAAARLLAGTGDLKPAALDAAYQLGEHLVEALARVSRDVEAPAARRLRALRLLAVLDVPAAAPPLVEALDAAWLARTARPETAETLLAALVDLGPAARTAVLAHVGPDSERLLQYVATMMAADDPRTRAAFAGYLARDPIPALALLADGVHDGAALARATLERALDAQPPDRRVAEAAVAALDELEAEVPAALRARFEAAPSVVGALRFDGMASSSAPPPGRNRPCPCGSGKKAKVCCAADDRG